jgi:dTDP-4-dehydrorhamnose reductase
MSDAYQINAFGVSNLALACRKTEVPLVHFSTDIVFDGTKKSPYEVEDCAKPLNVYGISKLAGENAVLAADPNNLVIRVSRLFGEPHEGRYKAGAKPIGNFPLLMLYLYEQGESIKVVNDQIGTPSYLPDVAGAIWDLLLTNATGLFHIANAGEVSYSDYAKTIFDLCALENKIIDAMPTSTFGAPAKRPLYSTLSCKHAIEYGVTPLRPWRDALAEFLKIWMSHN